MIKNILIVVVGLALIGLVYVFVKPSLRPIDGQVACSEEARRCLDGSYVGRIGPQCEFAACPDVPVQSDSELPNAPVPSEPPLPN